MGYIAMLVACQTSTNEITLLEVNMSTVSARLTVLSEGISGDLSQVTDLRKRLAAKARKIQSTCTMLCGLQLSCCLVPAPSPANVSLSSQEMITP